MCFEWVKRGYKVTVITGIPNYPRGKFFKGYGMFRKRKEVINGVSVVRLLISPRRKGSLMLVLNYFSFVISGWLWKTFTRIKADIVFNFEVSPMTQALPGLWYAKRRKIPFFIYVQDLWPENIQVIGGINNKFIIKSINKMVDNIYKKSTKILVTSESFKKNIIARGTSKEKVIYWPQYAEEFYKSLKLNKDKKTFNVMYTGNIGDAQGLEVLPELAMMLKKNNPNNNLIFTLIGDGRNKQNLEEIIEAKGLQDMFVFEGQKNPEEISLFLSKANIAFLSFCDNELFRMTIPAKLQTYLACGKPILAIAKGETKNIIEKSKSGLCSDPSDIDGVYKNIVKFMNMTETELEKMANDGQNYVKENFHKKTLLDELDELIAQEVKNV